MKHLFTSTYIKQKHLSPSPRFSSFFAASKWTGSGLTCHLHLRHRYPRLHESSGLACNISTHGHSSTSSYANSVALRNINNQLHSLPLSKRRVRCLRVAVGFLLRCDDVIGPPVALRACSSSSGTLKSSTPSDTSPTALPSHCRLTSTHATHLAARTPRVL